MRLGYIIIHVPDVWAAIGFYENAFGLMRRFIAESGEYGELDTGTTALGFASEALIATHGVTPTPNRTDRNPAGAEIAFITDNVDAAYAKALAAGAAASMAPAGKPWGQTVAYVRDLNGFLVELCTPMG